MPEISEIDDLPGIWKVERHMPESNRWSRVTGAAGNKSYATGWFHALTALLPHPRYRLVNSKSEVVENRHAARGPQPATPR